MTIKKSKQTHTVQRSNDKARALWLAGLGAFSLTQKRGGELISGLISEGHDFQTRTQKAAHQVTLHAKAQVKDALVPFRAGFKRNVKKLGNAVQSGIAGVLGQLGIPSKKDIEELTQRVSALSKQLKTAR